MKDETLARDIGPKLRDTSDVPFKPWSFASGWTDERVERLKLLHGAGESAAAIAADLGGGITRSAVCGKLFRLGLSIPMGAKRPEKPKRPNGVRRKNPGAGLHFHCMQREKENQEQFIPRADDVVPLNIEFDKLKTEHCRYPYGEDPKTMTYCGHPIAREGCSWCPSHLRHVSAGYPKRIVTDEQREARAARMRRYNAAKKVA